MQHYHRSGLVSSSIYISNGNISGFNVGALPLLTHSNITKWEKQIKTSKFSKKLAIAAIYFYIECVSIHTYFRP